MSENTTKLDISNQVSCILGALQRHTFFLISSLLLVVASSYSNYSIKIAAVQIPEPFLFYIVFSLVFFGYWNIWRLSSKLNQLISSKRATEKNYHDILFSHHWILNPFNNIRLNILHVSDCIPIAFVAYSSGLIGKYVVRYFNNTGALYSFSEMFPHFLVVGVVWFFCALNVFLCFSFVANMANIVNAVGGDRWRYLEFTSAIVLFLVLLEELVIA